MTGRNHLRAVLQALFVTLLWSTSWVLIKFGLKDIPAVTFAGLRYMLAFLCLLPFALQPGQRDALRRLTKADWGQLALLGVLYYAVTQGAMFVGLAYLPALTVSLLLNFTTLIVAFMGIGFLSEKPTPLQWVGVAAFIVGLLIYFYPINIPSGQVFGIAVVLLCVLANSASSILGRYVNRGGRLQPFTVTFVSMGVGAGLLMAGGAASQGLPHISPVNWLYIAWLAVVNTAFAFTLWNHTLRTLPAMESSIINGTMLIQIALLAWLFLGEAITVQTGIGMALAGGGALVVQLRKNRT